MDLPNKVRALIEALRNKPERPPNAGGPKQGSFTPSGRPLDQRRRGYQLYAQDAQANGEDVVSYEDWIRSQE